MNIKVDLLKWFYNFFNKKPRDNVTSATHTRKGVDSDVVSGIQQLSK